LVQDSTTEGTSRSLLSYGPQLNLIYLMICNFRCTDDLRGPCEAAPVDVPFTKAECGTGQPLPFPWGFERSSEPDAVAERLAAHAAGYRDR
jgi:hypothetical protein